MVGKPAAAQHGHAAGLYLPVAPRPRCASRPAGDPGARLPGFTDIVGGNNGGFTATPGYDEVTGIGALDIAALNPVIAGS